MSTGKGCADLLDSTARAILSGLPFADARACQSWGIPPRILRPGVGSFGDGGYGNPVYRGGYRHAMGDYQ